MADIKSPITLSESSVSSSPKEPSSPAQSSVDVVYIKKGGEPAFGGGERELEGFYEPIAEYVSVNPLPYFLPSLANQHNICMWNLAV